MFNVVQTHLAREDLMTIKQSLSTVGKGRHETGLHAVYLAP